MPQTVTFGRLQSKPGPHAPAPARERQTGAPELSAAAEAFRAQLASEQRPAAGDFEGWRRSRRWIEVLILAARVGSFAPGVATFLMDAPLQVSIGLEAAAVVGNVWVRRARFRRRREILAWEHPADAGSS